MQKINHGHPRKCISCNLAHPKPKTFNLRTNLSGPMKDTLFMKFSSKGKAKYWQIWYIVSNIYIVNKKDTKMAFFLSIYPYLWTWVIHCYSVFLVESELVSSRWSSSQENRNITVSWVCLYHLRKMFAR